MAKCVVVKALSIGGGELECESTFMDGFGSSGGRYIQLVLGENMSPNRVVVDLSKLPEGTTHLGITVE